MALWEQHSTSGVNVSLSREMAPLKYQTKSTDEGNLRGVDLKHIKMFLYFNFSIREKLRGIEVQSKFTVLIQL